MRIIQGENEIADKIFLGSHDDCVDALVWLCNGLMTKGKLELEY